MRVRGMRVVHAKEAIGLRWGVDDTEAGAEVIIQDGDVDVGSGKRWG